MTAKPDLFSKTTMGGLELQNRIVMAPLTRGRAGPTRQANAMLAEHYRLRASAGLIITEATTISEEANGWVGSPGIYTDAQEKAWEPVVEAVHEKGGKIFLQLWHTGRASHSDFHGGEAMVAPSAIPIQGEGVHTPQGKKPHETPRALRLDEIPRVIEDYRMAAERARRAGFDGVEIHSANGYLLDTFLQSKTNHRTDAYGGSVANRYRLLQEVTAAVNTVFPASRIGIRLSPNGVFNDMGSPDFRETFTYAVQQLDQLGLGYLHVMDGLAFGFHELGDPITLTEVRKHYSGFLMGNCGYELEAAQTAVQEGLADCIAFGRPFISNPDLVERFANGWPLNPPADPEDWYSPEATPKGYNDWPTYRATAS